MTTGSGFGRIGSYISGHWHQLYAVTYKKDSTEPAVNRSCSATDFEVGHSHAQKHVKDRVTFAFCWLGP